jgi:hypothetical protein
MADRSNHYEAAFDAWLRALKVPTLPIDETRRTFTAGETVKSLDFIVMRPRSGAVLIDVKGRSLKGGKPTLENWVRQEDVESLRRWKLSFGPGSVGLLAFVYEIETDAERAAFSDRFRHSEREYGCVGADVEDFAGRMKPRSTQWGTFSVPQTDFRKIIRPITDWMER